MKKIHSKHKVEHRLLPRLQLLGWLLILFGCGTFVYSFLLPEESADLSDTLEAEETLESSGPSFLPVPVLRREIVYLGIAGFWIIGTTCIIFARRRKKTITS